MLTTVATPPTADWVTIPDLYEDPFPIYARLRREAPVSWVPAINRFLITSYQGAHDIEQDQETFSANEEGSLMLRSQGHSMLRKDDPEHLVERTAWQAPLRPGAIKNIWQEAFEENFEKYFAELVEQGPGTDLIAGFAAPFAAENLRKIIGYRNATWQDLLRWSQTMIDATGNYADDPEVWAKGKLSYDEVNIATDEMIEYYKDNPDSSLISHLVHMEGYQMPLESLRANIKMTIGGGVNEPRDALGVAAWALFEHPDQQAQVLADPTLWPTVFEESIRWIAPIGLYPRQTTRDVVLEGVMIPKGSHLGISLLSANRDETVWDDPHLFDINRPRKPHLAFGGGTHFCAGAWVAKSQVASIALPRLFERLPGLRTSDVRPVRAGGWVFRGLLDLPVTWDDVKAAS